MKRRSFVLSGVAASVSSFGPPMAPPTSPRAWFELRFFHLRNDFDRARVDALLNDFYLPTSRRLGFGPVGFFNVSLGPNMPTLVGLTSYPSLAAMEKSMDQLAADSAWTKAIEEFSKPKEPAYTRMESRLIRAFNTMPSIDVPPQEPGRAPRLFELRVYESRNLRASQTKIKMFEEGEIEIFRKTGLLPVFFGETVVGTGLPSLTYMLAYDSVEAREENWREFLGHPDWIRLRALPGYSDSEIVSNINSCLLRPTIYSPIR